MKARPKHGPTKSRAVAARPGVAAATRRRPAESLRVRELHQVKALANPLRIRLLEAFAEAPRTTKQVAKLLGEKPTRLYHHVDALAKAGFLRLHSTRPNRGTIEKYFEAVARRFEIESSLFEGGGAAAESSAAVMARSVLDTTRAEVLEHIRSGGVARRGHEPIVGRMMIRGSRADVDELRARVLELVRRCERLGRAGRRAPGRGAARREHERWAVTLAFYPLAEEEA